MKIEFSEKDEYGDVSVILKKTGKQFTYIQNFNGYCIDMKRVGVNSEMLRQIADKLDELNSDN